MKSLAMVEQGNIRTYVLHNTSTGATVECTQKYLIQWVARGFEVVEIRDESFTEQMSKLSSQDDNI